MTTKQLRKYHAIARQVEHHSIGAYEALRKEVGEELAGMALVAFLRLAYHNDSTYAFSDLSVRRKVAKILRANKWLK